MAFEKCEGQAARYGGRSLRQVAGKKMNMARCRGSRVCRERCRRSAARDFSPLDPGLTPWANCNSAAARLLVTQFALSVTQFALLLTQFALLVTQFARSLPPRNFISGCDTVSVAPQPRQICYSARRAEPITPHAPPNNQHRWPREPRDRACPELARGRLRGEVHRCTRHSQSAHPGLGSQSEGAIGGVWRAIA